MARIKDSSVRDVVAAADMVEVVSGRTQLRRASGSRFTGRCPFHEEKTPSFSVNPVEKLYYCFGCGKGGDIISFVRETENLDFVGAVEWLAERFRVPIEVEEASPRVEEARRHRDRLYAVLDQTAAYFERLLWDGDAGARVREYLAGRGLGEEIAKEFRLGLSPGKGLAAKAKGRDFTLDELKSAGLVTTRGTDYFPQRLMFPLADARGRVVGFQARKLRDDDPLKGKYVNSPEGDLFHKSAVLYGLHLAKAAIGKQDFAAVVEGNTDVIALRQAGFEPVVASMGTALTAQQLRELARMTKKLYLCFDADAAGQEATLRGMELAATQGFDVKIVTLPVARTLPTRPTGSRIGCGCGELSRLPGATRDRALGRSTGGFRACARGAGDARRTRPNGRRHYACSRIGSISPARRWQGLRRRVGELREEGRTRRDSSTQAIAWSATFSPPASRIRRSCGG